MLKRFNYSVKSGGQNAVMQMSDADKSEFQTLIV